MYEYIITTFKIPGQVFSTAMFIAAGPTAASAGCAVHGHRLAAPAGSALDEVALAAAFGVAYMEGAGPVEAAGRAVLVAARLPASTGRGVQPE